MGLRRDFQESMPTFLLNDFIEKGKQVIVYNFQPSVLATDAPTKKRTVSGLFHTDDETYMLTLLTDQSSGLIKKIVKSEKPIVVRGVFSKELFTGNGGEVYRPIIGTMEAIR